METWFIIILTLCISALLKSFFSLLFPSSINSSKKLPPGPTQIPVIGRFLWLRKSFLEMEFILKDLKLKYGPILTIRVASRTAIFVFSHSIAHRALVQNGAVFSDRPKPVPTNRILSSNQHNISFAGYGPTWRLLRRNLTSEILHPSRIKSYSHARNWVLGILIRRLITESGTGEPNAIKVVDHFQYAMFCLLVLMCFGDKLEENQIKQIEKVQRDLLLSLSRFNILNLWPKLGKIVFRQRWKEFLQLYQNRVDVLVPLIKARVEKSNQQQEEQEEFVVAYADTLLNLQMPDEENRKLTYEEMVTLCGEFLNAGTDTTSTALEWIMANLMKYPEIQAKLYEEIVGVVGPRKQPSALSGGGPEKMVVVEEEDLQRMPYLKAVVLESLRRHPPAHFVLPHSVSEDVELDGYVVPKNAIVNFMVAEMGRDPKVWNDPMEFKPGRFLKNIINGESKMGIGGEGFDITGSREIKMMPFGAGRRICPGLGLALLHLEYFVANLIWYFEWKAGAGDHVDLSEKQVFTVVMKNPLLAHISPRPQLNHKGIGINN